MARGRTALVAGAAGFVGSHLVDRLLADGWDVTGVDDLSTGSAANLAHLDGHPRLRFVRADVTEPLPIDGRFDRVWHLASPSSPPLFGRIPLHILRVGSEGTWRLLERAGRDGARFLLTSTSEVYGDPEVHPQPEGYPGRVDPVGPRSCYDEGKRFAEALSVAFERERGAEVRIARLFNTYGPRLSPDDGRIVPTFFAQALRREPITVHGDGAQTRALGFVDDVVDGLVRLMESDVRGPCNLGRPEEVTVLDIARRIRDLCGGEIVHVDRPPADPQRRCPDITRARQELGWEPRIGLDDGLRRCLPWYRDQILN